MTPPVFLLPGDTRDTLLQYLAGRPWGESNPAMVALLSLKQHKENIMTPCEKLLEKINNPATPQAERDAAILEYAANCGEGQDPETNSGGGGVKNPPPPHQD